MGCLGTPFSDPSISPNENDYFHSARILVNEARYTEAARLLEKAGEMREGSDPEHAVYLAFCHLRLGEFSRGEKQAQHYQRALEAAEQASEMRPDHPSPWAYAGYIHLELGHPARSVAGYRAAIELEPSVAKWHWNLGMAEHQLGNRRAALEAWGEAVQLDPSYSTRLATRLDELGLVDPRAVEREVPADPE